MSSNSYWNRIDLHQHTNHDIDCTGAEITSNYTHNDYYKWLQVQEVKLKAVTNHNNIDVTEHIKHAIVSDLLNIKHLVGVEIDYRFDELEFQAITILSPNVDIIKFSNSLNEIRTSKGTSIFFNKEDFSKLHTEIEFIFIPHAIKDKGILEQTIGSLEISTIDWVVKSMISGMGEPILFENTKDYHIYSVAEKIKRSLKMPNVSIEIPAYVGSDYKFDNDSDRKTSIFSKPQYSIFSKPTYRGLEIAIRNSKTRLSLDSQVINREKYIKKIKVKGIKCFKENVIELSPGLNVIIGDSGSGKTLLLNQIYYQLKNKGLKASIKSKNFKKGENPYKSKVGKDQLLEIFFDKEYSNQEVELLEIPNIYSEILRTQENDETLPDMFGINNINSASKIMFDYKKIISSYTENLKSREIYKTNGGKNLLNIVSAIEFILKNKMEKTMLDLKVELFDDEQLLKLNEKFQKIETYIEEQDTTKKYLLNIKSLLSKGDDKLLVDNLLNTYIKIIEKLNEEKQATEKVRKKLLLEQKLYEIINMCISNSTDLLGNREKAVSERKTTNNKELKLLGQNIKGLIKTELMETQYNLSFPYKELKEELEKNCNDYARISLNDDLFNIKEVNLLDNPLFDLSNIKTIIKSLGLEKIDFTSNNEVKKLAKKLIESGQNLSNIICDIERIPKNIEIYLSEIDEWKLIQNTNKGDIAKKSIEYYFNDLIKTEQPDIILIDQPENDVDKSFITSTLSKFIKEQKIDKQIIITSHDAIVAINSDVNRIIEAVINEENKFEYLSYDLEYVRDEVLEATNRVSKILDGGKDNIKKRYQIYGGELNYENKFV